MKLWTIINLEHNSAVVVKCVLYPGPGSNQRQCGLDKVAAGSAARVGDMVQGPPRPTEY